MRSRANDWRISKTSWSKSGSDRGWTQIQSNHSTRSSNPTTSRATIPATKKVPATDHVATENTNARNKLLFGQLVPRQVGYGGHLLHRGRCLPQHGGHLQDDKSSEHKHYTVTQAFYTSRARLKELNRLQHAFFCVRMKTIIHWFSCVMSNAHSLWSDFPLCSLPQHILSLLYHFAQWWTTTRSTDRRTVWSIGWTNPSHTKYGRSASSAHTLYAICSMPFCHDKRPLTPSQCKDLTSFWLLIQRWICHIVLFLSLLETFAQISTHCLLTVSWDFEPQALNT